MNDAVQVRVSRRFDASAERVFDAWLDPATAGRWLYATKSGQMQRVEIDARVGGRYVIVEGRAEGDAEHHGRYLEIDRPHRLVFTLAADADSAGDVVTVEIVRDGRGCTLTLTHMLAAEWAQYADRTESGWADVLAALAAQLH